MISSSGQISLGKAFAGQMVTVERLEDGQWLVTPVQVVPAHLAWAVTPAMNARLQRFEERLASRSLQEANLDELISQINE